MNKNQKTIPNDRERYRLDQLARGARIRISDHRYTLVWPDRGAKRYVVSPNIITALVNNGWIRKAGKGEPFFVITSEGRKALDRKEYRK